MTAKFPGILLLLMAFLLIPGLGDKSIWGDEGWSVRFTDGDSPRETIHALTEDRHPPLYFLLLDGWREIAGEKEATMRLLAVFAALLTGAMVYQLGKALFGSAAGLAALLIFALMDKQAVFSQEVRHYTWLMLWAAASSWALWLYLRRQTFARALFLVAAVTGGLYTHSLYALVIVAHVIFVVIYIPLSPRPPLYRGERGSKSPSPLKGEGFGVGGSFFLKLTILYIFAAIAYSPWALVFYYQYLTQGNITHTLPIRWESAELLGPEFLGRPLALTLGLLLLGVASPFLHKIAPGWQTTPPRVRAVLLPLSGMLVPLTVILLVKEDGATLLNDRNLALLLPFMALLMGLGITAFTGYNRAALVIFLLVNGLLTTDADYTSPPWRPAAEYVAQRQIAHQPIVYNVYGEAAAMSYHLREEAGKNIPLVSLYDLQNEPDTELFTSLRFDKLADTTGFWFIFWGEDSPLFPALEDWGFRRTFTTYKLHFDNKIYMHRYDSVSLLDSQQTTYDDLLRLHQVFIPEKVFAGQKIYLSLWWSTAQTLSQDYTVSVILLRPDGTVAEQHDSFPQEGHSLTSQWPPDQLIYDAHPLHLPGAGTYQIAVKVYTLSDGRVLPTSTQEDYFVVGQLNVGEK